MAARCGTFFPFDVNAETLFFKSSLMAADATFPSNNCMVAKLTHEERFILFFVLPNKILYLIYIFFTDSKNCRFEKNLPAIFFSAHSKLV
jgi:hypothetical protein